MQEAGRLSTDVMSVNVPRYVLAACQRPPPVIDVAGLKLKFHWDQFSRNFPVANVTGKSPTSYEEVGRVGRVASLLRGSYEEAGDFQTISTCPDGLAMSPTSS